MQLSDLGDVQDSVEDVRNEGLVNGKTAVMVIFSRKPGANIIETVDRIVELLPQLEAAIPQDINLSVVMDRTPPIRTSLRDVERTLVISGILVILVVFAFLRHVRGHHPERCRARLPHQHLRDHVPVRLQPGQPLPHGPHHRHGLCGGRRHCGARKHHPLHRERDVALRAALVGAREIAFTVLSMSVSLVAVFIPLLLMGGMVGRLFREFAVTLSAAIMISLVVSLTTTPMMCAVLLKKESERTRGRLFRASERLFDRVRHTYERSLGWALRHPRSMLALMLSTIVVSIGLFVVIPKGFFPQQDIGRLTGTIQAAQDISFQAMREKMAAIVDVIMKDPDVDTVVAFTGSGGGRATTNTGRMFISLKPLEERKLSADQVIARLRRSSQRSRGADVSSAGSGPAHRRPDGRRPIPVHPPGGKPRSS